MKNNILVLGGTGFIGTNIIDYFFNLNIVKDNFNFFITTRDLQIINITNNLNYIKFDFNDLKELDNILNKFEITEVFHFLNTNVPSTSGIDIVNDLNSNLLNTISLLELMAKNSIKKIVFLSSGGTVYSNGLNYTSNFQEDIVPSPNNSYGIIKLTIENYIKLFSKNHKIKYLILRIPNIYGLHHKSEFNGIINISIRKALKNEILQIWGDGSIKKDYLFSKDLAEIFWKLYFLQIENDVINIGSGKLISINYILKNLKTYLSDLNWFYTDSTFFDTNITKFEIDKLKTLININLTPFETSLLETIEWETKNI